MLINVTYRNGQFSTSIGGVDVYLSNDEFQMLREGTVPSAIASAATIANIPDADVIRAARAAVLPEITIVISQTDHILGYIRNGAEGLVQWKKSTPAVKRGEPDKVTTVDLIRFNGDIGPVYLIDGETRGLSLKLNGIQYAPMQMADFYSLIRQELSIPAPTMQKLKEVINSWVQEVVSSGQAVNYRSSPIFVEDGIIKVDFPHAGDLQDILARLRNFHEKASHPLAYRTVLAWSILAPLHYALKEVTTRIIQTPQIFMVGKTKGGKTELANFYIGKGFNLPHERFFYSYEQVGTRFTMMKHLGETNLPALLDDLAPDWILQNKGNLKSYVQTGHFGDRGRSDQTLTEYKGKRSFIATINSEIRQDDDLAASMRLVILHFTERNRAAKNLDAWNALFYGVPDGFIYDLFRVIFEGQKLVNVLKDVEQFKTPPDWINYALGKLNMLSQWFGIPEWPLYTDEDVANEDSNAWELAQAFLAEWERIEKNSSEYYDSQTDQSIKAIKYRSAIEGDFKVEWRGLRWYIWFTPGAFKTIVAKLNLRLPYRTAADFLNNVQSFEAGVRVENQGQQKKKKIGNVPLRTYCISVPAGGEDDDQE